MKPASIFAITLKKQPVSDHSTVAESTERFRRRVLLAAVALREPICKLLPIAPSTHYDALAKRTDVDGLSACAHRDHEDRDAPGVQ